MSRGLMAGSLDREITLERATYTANALNEKIPAWTTLGCVRAAVSYKNAGEKIDGQQVAATLITRFTIRWSSDVSSLNPKDRLVFEGRTYDIHGVYELGRHVGLEIHATARAD